jgi:hypothetical protein
MTQSASYREDVEQLRRRFEEFRSTHAVRSRLPEELWGAASKLARRDGIEATARALDVDRPSLQKWTSRFEPRAEAKAPVAGEAHGHPGCLHHGPGRAGGWDWPGDDAHWLPSRALSGPGGSRESVYVGL